MIRFVTAIAMFAGASATAQERMPDGTYAIQRYGGTALPAGSPHTIAINGNAITTFDGCNVASGQAAVSAQAIRWIAPLSITNAECPDIEIKFSFESILKIARWNLREGILTISDSAGEAILSARAK